MVLASFQLRLSPQKVKLNLSVGNVTDRMNLVQEKCANKVVLPLLIKVQREHGNGTRNRTSWLLKMLPFVSNRLSIALCLCEKADYGLGMMCMYTPRFLCTELNHNYITCN